MNARKTLFIVMIFFAPASSAMATDGLEPLNAGTQTPARGGTIETQVAEKPNSNHGTPPSTDDPADGDQVAECRNTEDVRQWLGNGIQQ